MSAQLSMFTPLPCSCGMGPVWIGLALATWCCCEVFQAVEGENEIETVQLWNQAQAETTPKGKS